MFELALREKLFPFTMISIIEKLLNPRLEMYQMKKFFSVSLYCHTANVYTLENIFFPELLLLIWIHLNLNSYHLLGSLSFPGCLFLFFVLFSIYLFIIIIITDLPSEKMRIQC